MVNSQLPSPEQMLNYQLTREYTTMIIEQAARLLGWGRNTLSRKLKELEIDHER